ncbi:ATP-dependent DNA helicase RecG [Lacticaseibacillus pabuli]|uniref:ATP-dependent DNA helicase RecG n=1 Tax=Lacticaseibacillus pabuli TaxID=3025672 RepID=A0ABY7WU44_9LACO|nr:ATP-dependent DNA helicase RecG [Lacticaseibacillus sp. KACC 23028]WDF83688.1 ATP-dependent DNA helicase RecG [Lacticaseibacillus sp. KACC 23028]
MSLSDPITVLSGVGAKRAEGLEALGIKTVGDVLFYFPFRYDDLQERDLESAVDGEKITIKGTVVADPVVSRFGPRKTRVNIRLRVENVVVMVTFFNQPWLKDKFHADQQAAVYGKWEASRASMVGMRVLATQDEDSPSLAAIYPLSQSVHQKFLVGLIKEAFEKYGDQIESVVPAAIRTHFRLLEDKQLVAWMHFPETPQQAQLARRSAIFREFFLFEAKLQMIKHRDTAPAAGLSIPFDNERLKSFISTLSFELTNAQKRVVNEICADMRSERHMNRLLQGDVGSGKTIVAAICMYAAVTANFQAALMVPTEVLAEQHYQKLHKLFEPLPVHVSILTSSAKPAGRRAILADLASGETDIIIGTHALIQKDVNFANLGLAIIDEQHRFGVGQREILRSKGLKPDVLAMTATPIPRTLAITAYGEMDVSTIDELPAGRKPVQTTWVHKNEFGRVADQIKSEAHTGGQTFVITPLIAESEKVDLQNAESVFADLKQRLGANVSVALLHGQMKTEEKEDIMTAFSAGKIDVLVSTTVIEVGVDVPNATMMVILDADRFGLAQLHQLRGRVGRGSKAARCILVADPSTDTGISRMDVMTSTNDGFVVAQKDLELRGQGDIFGAKQSGMPDFRLGDPVGDFNILDAAQRSASELFTLDPDLNQADNQALRRALSATAVAAAGLN